MRRIPAFVLALVLAVAATVSPAWGQSQAEVDAARAEAARAQHNLDQAAAELLAAELLETGLETSLLQTIEHFEQTATELTMVGLDTLAVRAEIDSITRDVAELRRQAAEATVAAYRGASAGRSAVWLSSSFYGAALVGNVADQRVETAVELVNDLGERRRALEEGKLRLAGREQRLRELAGQLDEAEANLAEELGIARQIVVAALAEVAAADTEYQASLDRVQLEERRLAALAGVEHWRPLVERYFPAERVGEALQVMYCESRGNPDATNPTSGAAGLFQFLESTWALASVQAGFSDASRYDPEANVAAAAWLVRHSIAINHPRGAWGHWSCRPLSAPDP